MNVVPCCDAFWWVTRESAVIRIDPHCHSSKVPKHAEKQTNNQKIARKKLQRIIRIDPHCHLSKNLQRAKNQQTKLRENVAKNIRINPHCHLSTVLQRAKKTWQGNQPDKLTYPLGLVLVEIWCAIFSLESIVIQNVVRNACPPPPHLHDCMLHKKQIWFCSLVLLARWWHFRNI